ncbi:MAG TPA: hypothetical protein VGE88_06235 [Lysobacter sp.]
MTATEAMVIVGGAGLGWWVVAVFWPSLRNTSRNRPAPQEPVGPGWHEELGVPRNATLEQITAAYEARRSAYDADRTAHLPPELQSARLAQLHRLELAFDAARRDAEWLRSRD